MSDVVERAKAALTRRWEQPGPDYADPVCRGVVELGDWASEYLPELVAEVQLRRDQMALLMAQLQRAVDVGNEAVRLLNEARAGAE